MKCSSRMGSRMKSLFPWVLARLFLLLALWPLDASKGELSARNRNLPADFEQLLPRGALSSIDEPVFVAADEAEIQDDAWIFGVVIDGEARAYSLAILNSHEVVNDLISEQPVAAVW